MTPGITSGEFSTMGKAPKTPKVQGNPPVRSSPRDAAFGKPHAQLSVVLPAELVAHLKMEAVRRGETLRVLVLRALKKDGHPVDDADLADRRAEAARERSQIYRRGKGE